jgi:EmrB/QacA subfamily drug resistance transporter
VERTRNPWLALMVLCVGLFVILLDTTIVNVAIPSMIDAYHASLGQMLWAVNAYLLVFAVLLVTGGRLGDILGQRTLFTIGLGIFSLASALSGLAQDPGQMIAARVLQGIGAAILTPQTLVIISVIFPSEHRGAAFGILSGMAGLAALSGPALGGLLVTYVNWRWIFFVNVPIGIAGSLLAFWLVPNVRLGMRRRLDLFGVLFATAGLFGVVFALIEGQSFAWGQITGSSITIPEVGLAGIALLVGFLAWERFIDEPLLPLALFRNRNFSIAVWLNGLMGFALLGMLLLTTLDMQSVLGMSALQAGLTSTPLTLALTLVAPFAGRITDRIGGRLILTLGFLLYAAGVTGVAVVESLHTTSLNFAVPLALAGLGMGCVYAPLTTVAMRDMDPEAAGAASGALNTARQVGSALGSAVVGALLQNQLVAAMRVRAVTLSKQLPSEFRQRFIDVITKAGRAGLGLGNGRSGASQITHGLPLQLVRQVEQAAHEVLVHAYVVAMRPTLDVLAVALLIGVLTSLAIDRRGWPMPAGHRNATGASVD